MFLSRLWLPSLVTVVESHPFIFFNLKFPYLFGRVGSTAVALTTLVMEDLFLTLLFALLLLALLMFIGFVKCKPIAFFTSQHFGFEALSPVSNKP